ncbi:ABC transporter permease [Pseudorhodoplanes sp.]|uniref:ABC transporter permease n=1 Tax=Pseudorhodoplanes sp. TaxID=1934341 RepID=UPI00391A3DCF
MNAAALARSRTAPILVGLATVAALIALMQILVETGVLNRFIVPPPSDVFRAFERVIMEEQIVDRFLLTMKECVSAAALLAVFGISIGTLLYKVNILRQATETWVAAAAAAPTVLMYPLFMVIFGRSATTIIMMGFVAGLPAVILKTIEGLSGTKRVLINVGRSFNLTPWQLFWKIQFPSALPTIFTGFKLGLIFALINVVGVEFLINFGGLGQLINDLAERYDLAGTYAAICFVILVSVCFFIVVEWFERWLTRAA